MARAYNRKRTNPTSRYKRRRRSATMAQAIGALVSMATSRKRSYTRTKTRPRKKLKYKRKQKVRNNAHNGFSFSNNKLRRYGAPYKTPKRWLTEPTQRYVFQVENSYRPVANNANGLGFVSSYHMMYQTMTAIHPLIANSNRLFYYTNYSMRALLCNTSNVTAMVTIYNLVAKTESKDGPLVDWQRGFGAINNGTVNPSFNGLMMFDHPNNSPVFRNNFKIVRQTNIVLAPGEHHMHRFTYVINKMIKESVIYDSNSDGITQMKSVTCPTIIRVRGGIVGNDTPTPNNAATGQPVVTSIVEEIVGSKFVDTAQDMTNYSVKLPQANIIGSKVVNEISGEIEAVANV